MDTSFGVSLRSEYNTGVENDLSADDVTLKGISDLPGMGGTIKSTLDRHKIRSFYVVGYTHAPNKKSAQRRFNSQVQQVGRFRKIPD